MIRPSSLPMLAQCSCFESGGGEYADLGSDRHAALWALLNGDSSLVDLMDDEDQRGIRWAADYIKVTARQSEFPMDFERRKSFCGPDFEEISGTPDLICGPDLFDFKWRPRNYTAQMAAYALMLFENGDWPEVRVHLLPGAVRRTEVFTLTVDAAQEIVFPIIERAKSPDRRPTPCDYCGWCSRKLVCLSSTAKQVAAGYHQPDQIGIANWHPSQMESAEQIALGLTIWRKILLPWGKSMEFHAQKMSDSGIEIPGFERAERKGKAFIADALQAYQLSGLSADDFLKSCAVRLNTSKKYPDQLGLDSLFKSALKLESVAEAKRQVARRLEPVIQRTKTTTYLKSVGADKDEE